MTPHDSGNCGPDCPDCDKEYLSKTNETEVSLEIKPENCTEIKKWIGVWYKPWTWLNYRAVYRVNQIELIDISVVKNPPEDSKFNATPPKDYDGDPQKDSPMQVWRKT